MSVSNAMATRTATRTDNLASRLRQVRRDHRARRGAVDGSARELLIVAFALPLATLAVLFAVILATLLLAGADLGGVIGTLGATWLAVHQVPVSLSGVTIGALPLLPTLLVIAGTAAVVRSAGRDRDGGELGAIVAAAVGGPLVLTAMAVAVVMDGATTSQIQSPDALSAFVHTLLVHAAAAAIGAGASAHTPLRRHVNVSAADKAGLRFGTAALFALLAVGGILVTVRLILNWDQVTALFEGGYDFDGYLGLGVLSVLYLPNLIVGAAAILVGARAQVGTASVDLMTVTGGDVPPLPALAALPGDGIGIVGAAGFVVPVAIAVGVAVKCRSTDPLAHFRAVAVAGAVAAALITVLAELSGGRIGELGEAGVTPVTTGIFTLGWIVLIGGFVVLVNAMLPSARAARDSGRGARKAAAQPKPGGAAKDDADPEDDADRDEDAESDWDDSDWDESDWDDSGWDDEAGDGDTDDGADGREDDEPAETDADTAEDAPATGPHPDTEEPRPAPTGKGAGGADKGRGFDESAFDFGEMDLDEYDTEQAISRKLNDRL